MPFSNLTLMRETRNILGPHWGLGVLVSFVFVLIVGVPSGVFPGTGELVPLLLSGPLSLGFALFSLSVVRGDRPHFNQLFEGFQGFVKSFGLPVHDDFDWCWLCLAHHPRYLYLVSTFDDFFGNGRSPRTIV